MKKKTTLKKPTLSNKDVLAFAERPSDAPQGDKTTKVGKGKGGAKKNSPANQNGLSGKVPSGDVRLSACLFAPKSAPGFALKIAPP